MIELDTTWLRAVRPDRRVGHAIEAHVSIGSTNDRARELLAQPGSDGLVVVADEQTAGRGRRGRSWHSPAGRGLAVSVVLQPRLAAADAWTLPLAVALAAADACEAGGLVRLKWPNDLIDERGRKLGGILIETTVEDDRLSGAIIGIGLNTDWTGAEVPAEIRHRSISLAELARLPVDRVVLLDRLLDALSTEVAMIERGESPLDRYRLRCATIGTTVRVATEGGVMMGLAVDVGDHGQLIVESDGRRHELSSGDVIELREDPGR